jgi:hypothetical protein
MHMHPDFVVVARSAFRCRLTAGGKTVVREFNSRELLWTDAQSPIGENIEETDTHVLIIELKESRK